MKVYKLFTNPEDTKTNPLTWDRLMTWLAGTGFIEGKIGSVISPLDRPYLEEYISECWLQILSVPKDKMLALWYKGKGKFVNYLKSIIIHNVKSTSSPLYKNIRRGRKNEVYLDDTGWTNLINQGNTDIDIYYPQTNYDKSTDYKDRVQFESETITIRTENKLIENGD